MIKTIPNDVFFSWVETEISDGRSVQFRLKGNSMFPLLRSGKDDVLLCPCSKEGLKPMDVVLFRYKENYLLHRIRHIEGDNLYLQGDGSVKATEVCTFNDVVGKIDEIIRPGGRRISVNSRRWAFPSKLWLNLGPFRILFLRIAFVLMR